MFGYYDIPLQIVQEGISLFLQKEGESLVYKRDCLEEHVEKRLLATEGKILLNPVEPLNKPKALSSYFLVEFERSLVVEPRGTRKIFLTFPIEIAVYISLEKDFEVIDIFTLARQKFTLYGDPRNGVICKYWRSDVYAPMPSLDPVREGLIELTVANANTHWIELTKAIFNAYGMKLYYNDTMVSMKAKMNLKTGPIGEIGFVDSALKDGMNKSLEVYTARKLSITSTKFTMEFGL
jgi:hypothetical protein